jgi:predicted MPP superfamily phosphohydrolase
MGRIINVDIVGYLHINKKQPTAQYGFLHKHSTYTNWFQSISDWSAALNNKHSVDVVGLCIDFQKAFDTVSHPKLSTKLERYGLSSYLLSWIKAFLSI